MENASSDDSIIPTQPQQEENPTTIENKEEIITLNNSDDIKLNEAITTSTNNNNNPEEEKHEVIEDEMSDSDEMMAEDDEEEDNLNISAISQLSTKNSQPIEDSFYMRNLELEKQEDHEEEEDDEMQQQQEGLEQAQQHKILTQQEIEEMEKKYNEEIKSFFEAGNESSAETAHDEDDIQLASEQTSTAFSKSMDSFGKILYAQVVRHEERIETLTKSNKKLQEIVNKKNEKITKLQLQLSEMVKQIERYELALRQRMSPHLSSSAFAHQNPSTSSTYVEKQAQASPRPNRQNNPQMTPPPATPPLQTKLIKRPETDSPQVIDRPNKSKKRKSSESTASSSSDQSDPTGTPTPGTPSDSGASPRPIVKSRSKTVFKLKPADCVNYNGNTFVLARAFEDKYKLKKMIALYKEQGEGDGQLFLKDEDFKKLRIENPDNLSVFAYRTSLYTMDFVNFYMSNQ